MAEKLANDGETRTSAVVSWGLYPMVMTSGSCSYRTQWNWEDIDETAFTQLVRNHGMWCEHNSAADSPAASLYSTLLLPRRSSGTLEMTGVLPPGPSPSSSSTNTSPPSTRASASRTPVKSTGPPG